jgi:hypothetical protein
MMFILSTETGNQFYIYSCLNCIVFVIIINYKRQGWIAESINVRNSILVTFFFIGTLGTKPICWVYIEVEEGLWKAI